MSLINDPIVKPFSINTPNIPSGHPNSGFNAPTVGIQSTPVSTGQYPGQVVSSFEANQGLNAQTSNSKMRVTSTKQTSGPNVLTMTN